MKSSVRHFVAREQLKGHIDTLVLSALSRGPLHGYAVIQELAETSDGVFDLPEGTIYPALHRLEKQGLVSSRWEQGDTTRRRTYQIEALGRRVLQEQKQSWSAFSGAMDSVLGISPRLIGGVVS